MSEKTVEIDGVKLTESQVREATRKLDQSPVYERSRKGSFIDLEGAVCYCRQSSKDMYNNFVVYPNARLAKKAQKIELECRKIIMACLLVDPDYEPDFSDWTKKYYVVKHNKGYGVDWSNFHDASPAHVSSREKAEKVIQLLKEWEWETGNE